MRQPSRSVLIFVAWPTGLRKSDMIIASMLTKNMATKASAHVCLYVYVCMYVTCMYTYIQAYISCVRVFVYTSSASDNNVCKYI